MVVVVLQDHGQKVAVDKLTSVEVLMLMLLFDVYSKHSALYLDLIVMRSRRFHF